jgi:RNA polymerase sigma-70 factor (ECF subfamily)
MHDASARDALDVLDDAQRKARLASAMERLAPDQRAAIVLRVEHELSYEAVAQALGVEVGTVKSRIARARQALSTAVEHGQTARNQHG